MSESIENRRLTLLEMRQVQNGDVLRLVSRKGVMYDGIVEGAETARTAAYGSFPVIRLAGRTFNLNPFDVYRIREEDITEMPRRVTPTADEVLSAMRQMSISAPTVIAPREIARIILGFDAARDKPSSGYTGGKTETGWINEFIDYTGMKRTLKQMVEAGVLMEVEKKGRALTEVTAICWFPGRLTKGFVITEEFEKGKAEHEANQLAKVIISYTDQARQIVADRHADEVAQVIEELRTADGR